MVSDIPPGLFSSVPINSWFVLQSLGSSVTNSIWFPGYVISVTALCLVCVLMHHALCFHMQMRATCKGELLVHITYFQAHPLKVYFYKNWQCKKVYQ